MKFKLDLGFSLSIVSCPCYRKTDGFVSIYILVEGIAIAGLGYAISEAIVFKQKKAINRIDERARKAAHIISNLSTCLLIWVLGIQTTSVLDMEDINCHGIETKPLKAR